MASKQELKRRLSAARKSKNAADKALKKLVGLHVPKQAKKARVNLLKRLRNFAKRMAERIPVLRKRLKKKRRAEIKIKSYPLPGTSSMTGGGHKIVWHTTEGSTAAGAFGAYKATGAYPHFTLGEDGVAYQHLPLSQYATALQHIGPYETNRANAIQVEIVGFASESGGWSDRRYAEIAALARHIEDKFNVKRDAKVSFDHPSRLSGSAFVNYEGHCGHVHVPNNSHYDPGPGFRIGKVI